MTIKEIVEDIISNLTVPGSFRFGWKSFQNLKADEEGTFPLRYLDSPTTSNDSIKQSGLIEEDYPLTIAFLDKSELDFTPIQHEVIIAAQRVQRREFVTKCQNDQRIHFVKNMKTTDVVNIFDLNLSGIVLEITLTPFDEGKAC